MMTYNVYTEGYSATGEYGRARFLATICANTFLEAAEKACIEAYGISETKQYFKIIDGKAYFWGCQLFDNLVAAQKAFG